MRPVNFFKIVFLTMEIGLIVSIIKGNNELAIILLSAIVILLITLLFNAVDELRDMFNER